MTAQTLPDDPNYCFVPAYDIEDEVQQIRIVVDGMTGYIPTALVALTIVDAERLCDRLNAKLGLAREGWTALAAKSMRDERPQPGDRRRGTGAWAASLRARCRPLLGHPRDPPLHGAPAPVWQNAFGRRASAPRPSAITGICCASTPTTIRVCAMS